MQRVVGITLNGTVYQLEERGYNALFAYLDAMETQLKDDPNRAQALADLEQAIADKCQACIEPHKSAVTAAEIDRIISDMPPVAGQQGAATGAGAPSGQSSPRSSRATASTGASPDDKAPNDKARGESHPHRRLYQIREGGMVGGVCLGLATFFSIDVTFIRILFALFAVSTGGWGILAYVALMVILPHATTREQALSATYASGPAGPQSWPWDRDGWPWDRDGWPWDRPDWRRDRDQWRAWRHERRMARRQDGRSPFLSAFIIFCFVMLGFAWLSFWTDGGSYIGWPFFWGGPFYWGGPFVWGFPHWFGIILFFVFLRFLFGRSRI